jgi:hypothetical protein
MQTVMTIGLDIAKSVFRCIVSARRGVKMAGTLERLHRAKKTPFGAGSGETRPSAASVAGRSMPVISFQRKFRNKPRPN